MARRDGRKLPYLALKAANLVATTVWSFSLIFVLFRKLPIVDYSALVVVTALGAYLMACDLGLSGTVYARLRATLLDVAQNAPASVTFTSAVLMIYSGIAACAAMAFTACCFLLPIGSGQQPLAFSIYFASLALALPWSIVRAVHAASDHYIRFESVELARRLFNIALVGALFAGASFLTYACLALMAWVFALAAVRRIVIDTLGVEWPSGIRNLRTALAGNFRQAGHAGQFSLLEFGIFNLPYLLLPALYSTPEVLVAFDVFYKITRFGAQSNLVAFETMLPSATRAIHAADRNALVEGLGIALILSLIAASVGAAAVLLFGDQMFGVLLGNAELVPHWLRFCMAAMLFSEVFRAGGGILLLNTGRVRILLPACIVGVLLLLTLATVTQLLSEDFRFFMTFYVLLFATTSMVYFGVFVRRIQSAWTSLSTW